MALLSLIEALPLLPSRLGIAHTSIALLSLIEALPLLPSRLGIAHTSMALLSLLVQFAAFFVHPHRGGYRKVYCRMALCLDVRFFQSVSTLLVDGFQDEADDEGGYSQASQHDEGIGVVVGG